MIAVNNDGPLVLIRCPDMKGDISSHISSPVRIRHEMRRGSVKTSSAQAVNDSDELELIIIQSPAQSSGCQDELNFEFLKKEVEILLPELDLSTSCNMRLSKKKRKD
jgi:hypothetical protein